VNGHVHVHVHVHFWRMFSGLRGSAVFELHGLAWEAIGGQMKLMLQVVLEVHELVLLTLMRLIVFRLRHMAA
jgi:hypothetical protein